MHLLEQVFKQRHEKNKLMDDRNEQWQLFLILDTIVSWMIISLEKKNHIQLFKNSKSLPIVSTMNSKVNQSGDKMSLTTIRRHLM